MTPNQVFLSIASLLLCCQFSNSLALAQLIINNTPIILYNNGVYSSQFIQSNTKFSCSLNNLFTYQQSPQNLLNNTPYFLSLSGISQPTSLTISTQNGIMSPLFNTSSCKSDCTVQIRNFCPNSVNLFHYFDTVLLNIQGLGPLTYNVICNSSFANTNFQAGQFIIVICCFIIIVLTAIYNIPWACQIKGFDITYVSIAFYICMEVIGGTLILVDPAIAQIVGDIVIFLMGPIGMLVCFNELLHMLKIQKLKKTLINVNQIAIRITDLISFFIGIGILLSWIFNDKNWIISDFISLSVMIGTIKIFKITSFKKALILFITEVSIEIIFVILIDILDKTSYEDVFLKDFNNPLLVQLPTINPVYGLKCSWLPLSVTIFPGILLSYFHRFDKSRNTKIYLITSSIAFFTGSMIWIVITSVSPISFPFESITYPLMLILVILFAYNRKEINVLWNGKFYDAEFRNQQQYDNETYNYQMETKKVQINEKLFEGLKISKRQQESEVQSQKEEQSQAPKQVQALEEIVNPHQKQKIDEI